LYVTEIGRSIFALWGWNAKESDLAGFGGLGSSNDKGEPSGRYPLLDEFGQTLFNN
jgi:hypothetical protein